MNLGLPQARGRLRNEFKAAPRARAMHQHGRILCRFSDYIGSRSEATRLALKNCEGRRGFHNFLDVDGVPRTRY